MAMRIILSVVPMFGFIIRLFKVNNEFIRAKLWSFYKGIRDIGHILNFIFLKDIPLLNLRSKHFNLVAASQDFIFEFKLFQQAADHFTGRSHIGCNLLMCDRNLAIAR